MSGHFDGFIEVDDAEVLQMLRELVHRSEHVGDALNEIGIKMVESTQRRFETTSGPDNVEWAANSPVTVARKGFDWALKGETGDLIF
jgi:hypothetical protein